MKLPASIRIGPYKCKVSRPRLVYDAEGFANWGTFDTNTYEIEIVDSEDFKDDVLIASTAVHEIVHGINCIYGLPDDEETVRKQETAWMQVFKDNKTLIRAILKALK
jgi:hypothetical protein